MRIGRTIRAIREAKGIGVPAAERALGVRQEQISKLERGIQHLSEDQIAAHAKLLHCDPRDFWTPVDPPHSRALKEFLDPVHGRVVEKAEVDALARMWIPGEATPDTYMHALALIRSLKGGPS